MPPAANAPCRRTISLFERSVWSLQEAREILTRLIGDSMDWVPLDAYLDQYLSNPAEQRKTATRLELRFEP
jgi:hypothetical protein